MIGMTAVIPALVVSAISILTFLFGVLYTMSVYYHASDVDRLLPLPFLPGQIIFAKFLTTLLYEYLMVLLIGLPALGTYGILSGAGAAYYMLMLVALVLLPVTPLALASILVILLMRFSPAARNKDRFNMVSSIGIMVLTLGFVFLIQKAQSLDGADLAGMLAKTTAEVARVTAGVFPGSSMAAGMLADPGSWSALADLAGYLAVAGAAILILTLVARAFYFRGVMGVGASYARRRALTDRERQEATASGSVFWTYVRKDFRILIRTPIFFLNNVLMNVLFPVFFLVPILVTFSAEGTPVPALLEQLRAATFGPGAQGAPIALGILSAATILICGMNGITASALSREGSGAYFMKYIPMRLPNTDCCKGDDRAADQPGAGIADGPDRRDRTHTSGVVRPADAGGGTGRAAGAQSGWNPVRPAPAEAGLGRRAEGRQAEPERFCMPCCCPWSPPASPLAHPF